MQTKSEQLDEPKTPQLLTVIQCADALSVSHWTVRRLLKSGALPTVRIASRVLVKSSDLTSFIDQHRTVATDQPVAPSLAAEGEIL